MEDGEFIIRGAKSQYRLYFITGILLLVLGGWLGYQIVMGKPFVTGLLITLFFGLVCIALGVSRYITVLVINKSQLTLNSLFVHHGVNLEELTKAERYMQPVGKYPDEILRLTDKQGNIARVIPSYFSNSDVQQLVTILHPYIFRIGVDKNFMNLNF